jgi:uncharacterized protein (DUF1800 family)
MLRPYDLGSTEYIWICPQETSNPCVYTPERISWRGGTALDGATLTRRTLLRSATAGAALAGLPGAGLSPLLAAPRPQVAWKAAAIPAPDPIVHLVNRITFGRTPDDLAHARSLGFENFIAEQLYPENIDDDELAATLRKLCPTLAMSNARLLTLDKAQVVLELKTAAVFRAVASRRQLYEMMVDFWTNHFNLYHLDGKVAWYKTVDDRTVIRRYAFGKFRQLLGASAKSPAMLDYLNNDTNTKTGPNENYGREVMELHTLGVDAGYTQDDVEEVARCFTGWTIGGRKGGHAGEFYFRAADHDDGARTVLGHALPAGLGIGHGEKVLDILAGHPATAHKIATKLCVRFISDAPPESAVNAVAQAFTSTGGDIRETMRALLLSPEFRASADQKFKRPLELLSSAARTLTAQLGPESGKPLLAVLRNMGQLPFDWHPPNGYPDAAGAWANTNGLLTGWNLGLSLGGNHVHDVKTDLGALAAGTPGWPAPTAGALTDHLTARLLSRALDPADRTQIATYAAGGKPPQTRLTAAQAAAKLPGLVALILDSPYFQWR